MLRAPRSLGLAALAGVLSFASPVLAADGPSKEECAAAYEQAQTLRASSLTKARQAALTCAQESCPAVVQKDCAQWLGEIDALLPRVSVAVKDRAGQDTVEVKLFIDGELVAERLDAAAFSVDPGTHTFRVELEGDPPQEQQVVVREGEKGRVVSFSFAAAEERVTDDGPKSAPSGGGIHPATWVLGGIGIVGLGVFGTFGALGLSEKGDAESTCAPNCDDDTVSSIRTKFLVADIGLGVGIAALGAAVVVAIVSSGGDDEYAFGVPGVHVGAAPLPGGGFGSFAVEF